MSMQASVYIYLLLDPNPYFKSFQHIRLSDILPHLSLVRYVGKTSDLKGRYKDHISNTKNGGNIYKTSWVNKLKRKGQKPLLVILEITSEDKWRERETYWIKYFRDLVGRRLVNSQDEAQACATTSIIKFNRLGEKVSHYDSLYSCIQLNPISHSELRNHLTIFPNTKMLYEHFYIRESDCCPELVKTYIKRVKSKDYTIYQLSSQGKIINVFDTNLKAATTLGLNSGSLFTASKRCNEIGFFKLKGYFFILPRYHDFFITNSHIKDWIKEDLISFDYRTLKQRRIQIKSCLNCGKDFYTKYTLSKYCSKGCRLEDASKNIPTKEKLIYIFQEKSSFTQVGKHFGVSDNAVRKWCVKYDLPKSSKKMKKYLESIET